MKRMVWWFAVVTALAGTGHLGAAPVLTVDPVIYGWPGNVAGWGFSLANDDSGYLVAAGSNFFPQTPVGTYNDLISQSFTPVAPLAQWIQAFDLGTGSGFGYVQIDPTTPVGTVVYGYLELQYMVTSVDPNSNLFDPGSDIIATGLLLDTNQIELDVVTPEPGTAALWDLGLAGLYALRRRTGAR